LQNEIDDDAEDFISHPPTRFGIAFYLFDIFLASLHKIDIDWSLKIYFLLRGFYVLVGSEGDGKVSTSC
jgi:hypothetical protein